MKFMKEQKTNSASVVSEKRFEIGFRLLDQWLSLRQAGKRLTAYFEDNLVDNIAIYGMGVLGERLYDEMRGSKVKVGYGIDRIAASKSFTGLKIYGLEEKWPQADAIVVTPVQDYWEIVEKLEMKIDAAIISLDDILDYCAGGDEGWIGV